VARRGRDNLGLASEIAFIFILMKPDTTRVRLGGHPHAGCRRRDGDLGVQHRQCSAVAATSLQGAGNLQFSKKLIYPPVLPPNALNHLPARSRTNFAPRRNRIAEHKTGDP